MGSDGEARRHCTPEGLLGLLLAARDRTRLVDHVRPWLGPARGWASRTAFSFRRTGCPR